MNRIPPAAFGHRSVIRPASAPGPVEVHIDNIQIIPFTNGTIIEASDLNANAF